MKYISETAVYLDAGKNAGLEEGMILHIVPPDPDGGTTESVRFRGAEPLADVRVFSVADTSAAAEIITSRGDLAVGDIACLDVKSIHAREDKVNATESANYPVVVTFSSGDPLDEEIRATTVTEKMLVPIRNQIRGRIGVDFGYLSEPGGVTSRQTGLLIDADISRIGGTHWNFKGYWRGDLTTQNSGNVGTGISPLVLNELLNHTYTLGLYYENPDSIVTAGVGRLYLPYAPSLSAIDGAYFGYKIRPRLTVGVFGGSTPDPTSWSYAPNQRIAGAFVNYAYGDFDHLRLNDTFGLASISIGWHIAREFAFAENTISFGHGFSIYNSLQVDAGRTVPTNIGPSFSTTYSTGLTQSFSSIRYQPIHLLTFSLNDNYLRNLPTFDPALIATGLVDQYLFQGLSGGVTVQLPYRITVSTDIGKSRSTSSNASTTDKSPSWNQMYGLTFGEIKKTGLQLDLRYTKFSSPFGQGQYEYVSISRSLADRFHVQLQGGRQNLTSSPSGLFTSNTKSTFITSIVDMSLGPRFFIEGLYSYNMGTGMNYSQMNFTFGYRFGGKLRK
ncbi:MAG TPA: hypothetical protein VKS01_10490 [Bryobacteraceae bacterium]|nr:hypothetical protein [Bryobacteraceae bacterium]